MLSPNFITFPHAEMMQVLQCSPWKTRKYLSYIVNTGVADALVMQGLGH